MQSIFQNNTGVFSVSSPLKGCRTAVLKLSDTSSVCLFGVVMSIAVQQSQDFSVTKTIDQNLVFNCFGQNPVRVVISGIQYAVACGNSLQVTADVQQLYNKYKVGNVQNLSKYMQLYYAGSNVHYKIKPISFSIGQDSRQPTYTQYTMQFIGVAVKQEKT